MGLDQMWVSSPVMGGEWETFHTHRKLPALEAYMSCRWHEESGLTFNCEYLTVEAELLDTLQQHVTNKTLDHDATGFFWGKHYDEDYADIQEAIDKARAKLILGYQVAYTSWW
jgi:hypothetical protein